ncbi:M48 family metalloprotease [Lentzea sp. BCCO 10_0798]|uniref:M48 family metalloprotease n=1 Tax=Lentzea kristufekii TaxID=3095430 RepID=A0ABU4TNP4_9PSEU|nr:M48 family metalloprotease [Lentzea sp. BCCO 10_0798]MDX8049913.1 M48 family metalloprotease [Lentzea sp. BCCO 10_0798]
MRVTVRSDPRRADERVIGAGTTVRFVLLMVLLFVASGAMMRDVVRGISGSDGLECVLAGGADPDAGSLQVQLVLLQQGPAFDECIARHQPPLPWWVGLGWPVVVLLGAAVLFRAIPAWRRHSRWVKPLDNTHDAHRLVAEAAAGLVRMPRLVVDPTKGVAVYGSNRRPTLRLSAEMVVLATTDPERFRGVVLHELAHIRNRDVTLHYFTVALWRVFLGAVLVPYATWAVVALAQSTWWSSDHPIEVRRIFLVVLLVVLVYLARADVLRSREVCADLAAARWGAPHRTWEVATPGPVGTVLASFTELWRTHPRLDLRRAAMAGTGTLFGLRALPTFLTGVAATLVNTQVLSYLQDHLTRAGLLRGWGVQALMLVSSGLVVGVVGVALWRAVVHAVQTSRPAPSGARIGLWLGCGLAVGELFLNRVAVGEWLPPHPEILVLDVLAAVAVTWWIGQCAHLWATVRRATRLTAVAALGAAWLALASWFVWWQSHGTIRAALGEVMGTDQVRDVLARGLGGPSADHAVMLSAVAAGLPVLAEFHAPVFVLIALSALWLVPLLAWTVRPPDGTPRWLRSALDDARVVVVEEAPIPRLRRVLLPGLISGALAGAAVAGLQAYLHTWRPLPRGAGALFALTYQTSVLLVLVVAAVVPAIVAAVRAGRYRLLVALIAAETAVVIGFALAFVLMTVDGCIEPLRTTAGPTCRLQFDMSGFAVRFTLVPAAVVAALTAFVAAGVVATVRRTPVLPPRAPGTLALRRRAVAVVCVVATALTVTATVLSPLPNEVSDAKVVEVFSPPAATQSPARTRAAQVYAWRRYGGTELNTRLADVIKRHVATLQALGSATGPVDVSPLRPTCTEFGQIARDAERYFRVPDSVAQQHWSRYIELAKRGSANCVTALEQGPERLLHRSLDELANAMSAVNSTLGRLTEIQDGHPQGGR